jgi:hypothetical protein
VEQNPKRSVVSRILAVPKGGDAILQQAKSGGMLLAKKITLWSLFAGIATS